MEANQFPICLDRSGQPVRVLQTNPRKLAGIGTCLESIMSVAVKTGASNLCLCFSPSNSPTRRLQSMECRISSKV